MKLDIKSTLYEVKGTSQFKKSYKKMLKQGKDINKIKDIIIKLANNKELDKKHRNHKLTNDNNYQDCYECHIEPNWLLIYKYYHNELILLMINTGSHSEVF